jgi:hypothetical protein
LISDKVSAIAPILPDDHQLCIDIALPFCPRPDMAGVEQSIINARWIFEALAPLAGLSVFDNCDIVSEFTHQTSKTLYHSGVRLAVFAQVKSFRWILTILTDSD